MPIAKPGERFGGRVKGTPNKLSASAKEAIQLAFEGLGGTDALIEWAKDPKNKGVFYSTIYPKLVPHEVTGANGGPVQWQAVNFGPPPDTK